MRQAGVVDALSARCALQAVGGSGSPICRHLRRHITGVKWRDSSIIINAIIIDIVLRCSRMDRAACLVLLLRRAALARCASARLLGARALASSCLDRAACFSVNNTSRPSALWPLVRHQACAAGLPLADADNE